MSFVYETEKAMDFGGMWGRKQRIAGFAETVAEMLEAAPEADLEQALNVKRQNKQQPKP
jgi:hypothetical protein